MKIPSPSLISSVLFAGLVLCPPLYAASQNEQLPPSSVASGVDVGISTGDPASLQAGIQKAYQQGFKKVIIPPGVYRIPRPENESWHLRFADMKDFEIEASGATFVMLGRDRRALLFDYCKNVTLRGATLLRETPPFSQGKIEVIAADRSSVDVRIDAGYPADLDDKRYFPQIPVFNTYQKGTRRLKPLVPDIYIARVERIGDDLFRFHTRARIDPRLPLTVGDPVAWRGRPGSDLSIWSSGGMRMENVTIKNGNGIAFMELCGAGDNAYIGCTITYASPPAGASEVPLLACALDGFHSASLRKGPRLENCSFEGLNDDQVNIHGTYAMVVETKGTSVIVDWRAPHSGAREPFPFAQPGDTIRFYDREGALCGTASAVSIRHLPDHNPGDLGKINSRRFSDRKAAAYFEVTVDRPVSAPRTGLAANVNTTGSGFVIRNSTFRNNRAHGLFIRASDGLIENNTIEGSMMAGIVIAPEMNSWNESDYARNITIQGNTLRNVGIATQPWNSGITVAAHEYGAFVPLPGGHRDIVIRDNRLEDNRGPNIVITSAIGVEISGNQFINPMSSPVLRLENIGVDNDKALIWMRHAENVRLHGNTVLSPGEYFEKLVDADQSVTVHGLPGGVILTPKK